MGVTDLLQKYVPSLRAHSLMVEYRRRCEMKQRIEWIDVTKGMLIILVIVGHSIEKNTSPVIDFFMRLIYSFHMPAFFIISGILLHYNSLLKKSFLTGVISLAQSLLIPWLFSEIIGLFEQLITLFNQPDVALTSSRFVHEITYRIIQMIKLYGLSGSVWFLSCLFLVECAFLLIRLFTKFKYAPLIIALIGYVLCYRFSNRHLMYVMARTFVGLGWFSLGYCLKPIYEKHSLLYAVASLTIISLGAFFFPRFEIHRLDFNNVPFLYVLFGAVGTYLVIYIARTAKSSQILEFYGKNTIPVLMTQRRYITYITQLFALDRTRLPVQVMLCAIVVIIEYPTILLMSKLFPHLIGKKKIMHI